MTTLGGRPLGRFGGSASAASFEASLASSWLRMKRRGENEHGSDDIYYLTLDGGSP